MSETTRKLRKFGEGCEGHKLIDWYHMYLGMDLAADAIEAVEAQVAEAVARVAALEEMGRLGASPNGDDRTRGGMPPRGFDSPTPAAPTPPAPSAVPAPRGFREGDIVRIKRTANGHEGWHGQEGPLVRDGIGLRPKLRFKGIGEPLVVAFHPHEYDLVRAADAPEAPAEDAGLVERLAEAIRNSTPGKPGTATSYLVPSITAILATLRAEGRLCAPGEVARLTAERDEAREFHELAEGDIRKWIDRYNERDKDVSDLRAKYLTLKARAEAADIRADGHAEGLRSIRKMLKQSPPDVDRAILWCDDSLSGYTQSVAATEAETNDRALAAEARAEAAEKALAEARAISAATAERVRNETQIATELRKDLADARDRIASKDRSIEVMLAETRALREALDAERSGVATKLHDAGFNNVENLVGAYRFERAQADALRAKLAAAESDRDAAFSKETALRRDLLAWQDAAMEARGERDEFKRRLAAADREQERLRAELAALKAKPRSRTRPVTAADLDELEREYNKADYKANEEFRAASALGFRRRVDGAK